jgi:hypothetical protein
MRNATLYTESGTKELDHDVAKYIQHLQSKNESLITELNSLKIQVFRLEAELSRGWFYRTFFR